MPVSKEFNKASIDLFDVASDAVIEGRYAPGQAMAILVIAAELQRIRRAVERMEAKFNAKD